MKKLHKDIGEPAESTTHKLLCIKCAGALGGRVDQWINAIWHMANCSECGTKTEVTSTNNYIWR